MSGIEYSNKRNQKKKHSGQVGYLIAVPADGVKGKTWGPSTCHQRERGQITNLRPVAPNNWSKSAPNLDKTRSALARPQNEIGNNTSPTNSTKITGFHHIFNIKRFGKTSRNNSFPINNTSLIQNPGLGQNNRLSRSFGNIAESEYDTVFTTNSFVIARGVNLNHRYANVNERDEDDDDYINDRKLLLK